MKEVQRQCGLFIVKVIDMLVFFWLYQSFLIFLFGDRLKDYTDHFWWYVFAGLLPAFIAEFKNRSFWLWWGLGTVTPILSTFMIICMDANEDETIDEENSRSSDLSEGEKETL